MFSIHYPNHNYGQILEYLSTTKTNSVKTSSLPLADFWHPERNCLLKKELFDKIGVCSLNFESADYCFEYPTPAYEDGESGKQLPYSRSSMTDLMIIFKDGPRVTIEAKYTEFEKDKEYKPTLNNWLEKKPHKEAIAQCWLDYIFNNGFGEIDKLTTLKNSAPNLPYQFLHRTASACFKCNQPILVYQLFFENNSINRLKDFEEKLKESANNLKLNQTCLPFFIVEVLVEHYPEPVMGDASSIFVEMKNTMQYKFGKAIKVLNGYSLDQII